MAEQLSMDGRDPRVKVVQQKWYGPDWWASKCTSCGGWLSKYDFTEQDAHDLGVSALDKPGRWQHHCG